MPELVRDGLSIVMMTVPRHKLGDEIVRDLDETGTTARVYRGREADDPAAPGEKMCREHERAAAMFHAMGDAAKHACGKGEQRCEFYNVCGYRQQAAATLDIWVVPHELLFHPQPKFIPAPAVLAIDKSFWDAGLEGTETPVMLPLAWLARECQHIHAFPPLRRSAAGPATHTRRSTCVKARAGEQESFWPVSLVRGISAWRASPRVR